MGALHHRGAGQRGERAQGQFRDVYQDPPRGHRRHLGHGDHGGDPRPVARLHARPRDHHDQCRQRTFRAGDGTAVAAQRHRQAFPLVQRRPQYRAGTGEGRCRFVERPADANQDIPRTRFNGSVSPHRVFDAISVPLDDVKAIKNAVPGATVNDAAITIVGGALRKYLQAHGELPAQSLAAMAPVNVRSDKDKTGGNIVASMTVQVRSDLADPLERLQAVRESSSKAKELTNAIGAKTMTDYSQFIPATLTAQAARLASRWGLMNRMSPQFNCVITNVPGPPIPLYNTGAKMVANYGTGPVQDGLGLFHVISSYCGQFVISATSCRVMMPDPAFYRQCLRESFEELLAAATAGTVTSRPGKTSPAKKKKRAPQKRVPQKKARTRKARRAA
ncbi:MAG: DUF1298 domain-containing protein [Haliea sp.]|nr:DUF1298 domain-containing protein [Haliea sp.]